MEFIEIVIYLSSLIIGYLFGSIPTGLIIGKLFFKKDIREHGSKNIGGTNTGRVLGKKVGLIVIILDALKIILPFWAMIIIFNNTNLNNICDMNTTSYLALLGACLGHCFSIFIGFKGGKAVATFAGCLLATNWLLFIIFIVIILLVLKITKYVSLGSIIASVTTALLSLLLLIPSISSLGMWQFLEYHFIYSIVIITNATILVLRHRGNIKRLQDGTERKITWMK